MLKMESKYSPPSSPSSSPQASNITSRTKKKSEWSLWRSDAESKSASTEDKDKLILALKNEITQKDAALTAMQAKIKRFEDSLRRSSLIVQRKHPISATQHVIHDKGKFTTELTTRGSVATGNILKALGEPEKTPTQLRAEHFIAAFQDPVKYVQYLASKKFAADIIAVCGEVAKVFEAEARCVFLQSPAYVIGDIHGNLEDLHFFADNLWKQGMDLSAGRFVFLGDYVDRGLCCLECIAYLFGLKLLYPRKIVMLRGNHETRSVNGWEDHYGEKSFLYQCKARFGRSVGEEVWEECNRVFDRLPLSAVIDHDIFCVHGGFPRPIENFENEVQAILAVPPVAGITPPYSYESDWQQQVATDCIWSDPAREEQEARCNSLGFAPSLRGGDCVCFGMRAIENFCDGNGLSFIVRAHEAHAHGVSLSKAAKVFTVFSTSKDHGQGKGAMAGCILVDCDRIQVINRSPAYKEKYVHHRQSMGVDLSDAQIEQLTKMGLLKPGDSFEHSIYKRGDSTTTGVFDTIAEDAEEK